MDNNIPNIPPEKENFWRETVKFAVIALAIVLPFRYLIAQPFIVSGESMVPTFANGEYLIVDELTYRFIHSPERNDVVIFKYPYDRSKYFIKRIIGLPGETITLHAGQVSVKIASSTVIIQEPYISEITGDELTVTLKDNQYFVLGDNRPESSDSRIWGPLDKKFITGRAFARLLPLRRLDIFPGQIETKIAP
ncbi:MAG: Signal peptidase I [Parcubacteria group bacterium GW2011_GWB1_44_7]|nr:MAG: Signal peptidase I [Parcubacteria group bacterium GW2011_GWB1_44_7]